MFFIMVLLTVFILIITQNYAQFAKFLIQNFDTKKERKLYKSYKNLIK